MAEWSNAPDSKSGLGQPNGGSNPSLSANLQPMPNRHLPWRRSGPQTVRTTFNNYIAGEWIAGASSTPNRNPSNLSDVIGEYAQAIPVRRKRYRVQRRALPRHGRRVRFRSARTAWTKSDPRSWRARTNSAVALPRGGQDACPRVSAKSRARARSSAFSRAKSCATAGEKLPSVRPGVEVEVTREPIGVVGIITPWNFPIAIPAWKIAPALAYGNTVVFKPADFVPGCAWALADIIARAGFRRACSIWSWAAARWSARRSSTIRPIAAISFTGSVGTGRRHRRRRRIARMAKLQLEMGGKNPLIVLDDADLATAVERRGAGRLLLDRPALHGVVATDRHRGHSRPLRRGARRTS